jgi:hypothetical protein
MCSWDTFVTFVPIPVWAMGVWCSGCFFVRFNFVPKNSMKITIWGLTVENFYSESPIRSYLM